MPTRRHRQKRQEPKNLSIVFTEYRIAVDAYRRGEITEAKYREAEAAWDAAKVELARRREAEFGPGV